MDRLTRRDDEWDEIRKMPRTFKVWDKMTNSQQAQAEKYLSEALNWMKHRVHESVFRSYSILEQTKKLLEAGVPGDVVLSVIYMLEKDLPDKNDT